jgi:predicted nuclease of predicted toxin-antitoxin system
MIPAFAPESPASGGLGSRSRGCSGCSLPAARAIKSSPTTLPRAGRHRRGPTVCRAAGGGRDHRIGTVKFLVNMPLPPALEHLLAQGHKAVRTSAAGLDRSPESKILTRVRDEDRTVVTADLDYPRLLALAGAEGQSLILFRGGNWSEPDVIAQMQQNFSHPERERDNAEPCCRRSHSSASTALADNVTAPVTLRAPATPPGVPARHP